jgi:predicted dehydrogenase
MKHPHVLVVGAGMYVAGRGTNGYGTVLPVLVQAQRDGLIGEIHIAATRPQSGDEIHTKVLALNHLFGHRTHFHTYPADAENDHAYLQALAVIPKPAVAIVVVPDHLHAPITIDIIKAGLHALVVKPFTPTVAEADTLIDLLTQQQLYGAVEFHKRFDEANLLLRRTIQSGQLGELAYITVEYSQRRIVQDLFKSWLTHTNIFQYLGVHYVDLIHFVTGAKPLRVLALGQTTALAPNAIHTLIEWQAPAKSHRFFSSIVTNWIDSNASSSMSDQKVNAVGLLGRYQSDQKNRGVQIVTPTGIEDVNPYFTQLYKDAVGEFTVQGYGPKSVLQFLEDVTLLLNHKISLAELNATRPSFESARLSTQVIEAAQRSLTTNNQWSFID